VIVNYSHDSIKTNDSFGETYIHIPIEKKSYHEKHAET